MRSERVHEAVSVTSSTFAGATADLPDGEYSIQEVHEHIKAWLEKEV